MCEFYGMSSTGCRVPDGSLFLSFNFEFDSIGVVKRSPKTAYQHHVPNGTCYDAFHCRGWDGYGGGGSGRQMHVTFMLPRSVVSKHRLFPGIEESDGRWQGRARERLPCVHKCSSWRNDVIPSPPVVVPLSGTRPARVHDGEARTELIAETRRTTAATAAVFMPLRRHPMFADDVNAPSPSRSVSFSLPSLEPRNR